MFMCSDYFAWNEWMSSEYYEKNDIISHRAMSTIIEKRPEELNGILIHTEAEQLEDFNINSEPTTACVDFSPSRLTLHVN